MEAILPCCDVCFRNALSSYNSLLDPHLSGYFSNTRRRKQLRKAGLVTRQGEVVTEQTYRLRSARLEQRDRRGGGEARCGCGCGGARSELHAAQVQRKIEEILQLHTVRRMKTSDDSLPLVTFSPRDTFPKIPEFFPPLTETRHKSRYSRSKTRSHTAGSRRRKSGGSASDPSTEQCRVTMVYHGSGCSVEYDRTEYCGEEVTVEQQHCGGSSVIAFRKLVMPGSRFSFVSRRRSNFPFSLTLYVNRRLDSRVSACCEYKHQPGLRLGGRTGHFGIDSVKGSERCYRCQLAQTMRDEKDSRLEIDVTTLDGSVKSSNGHRNGARESRRNQFERTNGDIVSSKPNVQQKSNFRDSHLDADKSDWHVGNSRKDGSENGSENRKKENESKSKETNAVNRARFGENNTMRKDEEHVSVTQGKELDEDGEEDEDDLYLEDFEDDDVPELSNEQNLKSNTTKEPDTKQPLVAEKTAAKAKVVEDQDGRHSRSNTPLSTFTTSSAEESPRSKLKDQLKDQSQNSENQMILETVSKPSDASPRSRKSSNTSTLTSVSSLSSSGDLLTRPHKVDATVPPADIEQDSLREPKGRTIPGEKIPEGAKLLVKADVHKDADDAASVKTAKGEEKNVI